MRSGVGVLCGCDSSKTSHTWDTKLSPHHMLSTSGEDDSVLVGILTNSRFQTSAAVLHSWV
jgi:hypothetical protein